MRARSALQAFTSIDAFRRPKREALTESTWLSSVFTAVAAVLCTSLFACQLHAFISTQATSRLEIDSDESQLLRINFDVTMRDLHCDYATIGVFDSFGTVRANVTRNIQKQHLDHEGVEKGHPFTEEELAELEFMDRPQLTAQERAELDSDWVSVGGSFKHSDFRDALEAHDFVFVLFCAAHFGPCRMMLPAWNRFATGVNSGTEVMNDADGRPASIHALQVNCAPDAYIETCKEQEVTNFPSIRLYPRSVLAKPKHVDINFAFPIGIMMASMAGMQITMDEGSLTQMVQMLLKTSRSTVAERHLHSNATHHAVFREGCRLRGYVDVPRVPGTLHFEARSGTDQMLNYAFTNVSHQVNHLSFGDSMLLKRVPSEFDVNTHPLDGRSFDAMRFHQAPHHFLKVVHARLQAEGDMRIYLLTHQWHLRTFSRHEAPKAQVSFDLAPVELVIGRSGRRWYDFATSTLAIVGGAFAFVTIFYNLLAMTDEPFRRNKVDIARS